jgi:purine nucleosidase
LAQKPGLSKGVKGETSKATKGELMAQKVIVDTDPGIDDALAIFIALASAELDVIGLTTVCGNIGIATTTRNAGRILALADRSRVPVLAGSAKPLVGPGFDTADIHGNDGLGGVDFPEPEVEEKGDAIEWMSSTLRNAHPGAIDILALGPLTNIARLVLEHPDAAQRIGRIIAMGGAVHEPGNFGSRAEFNLAADPDAADVVLRAGIPLVMVPLDVTRRVRATPETLAQLRAAGKPVANACAALIEAYFQSTASQSQIAESRPLHDPCVMALAVDPSLFNVEQIALRVDVADGALVIDENEGVAVNVAMKVDGAACLTFMVERMVH